MPAAATPRDWPTISESELGMRLTSKWVRGWGGAGSEVHIGIM